MMRILNLKKLFAFFLLLQIISWWNFKNIRPEMSLLPPVISEKGLKANSFGDEQFYFRFLLFKLQNAGDLFGQFTALKNYDYEKLFLWFMSLDLLDSRSHFTPSVASYYYSQTQNRKDVIYIVKYLEKRYDLKPQANWWWMSQAVYLASHKLEDKKLALRLAIKLANSGLDIPIWAKQMPAFIHEQLGQNEEAYVIIKSIIDDVKSGKGHISEYEMNFMQYFIEERLEKLKEDNENEK